MFCKVRIYLLTIMKNMYLTIWDIKEVFPFQNWRIYLNLVFNMKCMIINVKACHEHEKDVSNIVKCKCAVLKEQEQEENFKCKIVHQNIPKLSISWKYKKSLKNISEEQKQEENLRWKIVHENVPKFLISWNMFNIFKKIFWKSRSKIFHKDIPKFPISWKIFNIFTRAEAGR